MITAKIEQTSPAIALPLLYIPFFSANAFNTIPHIPPIIPTKNNQHITLHTMDTIPITKPGPPCSTLTVLYMVSLTFD